MSLCVLNSHFATIRGPPDILEINGASTTPVGPTGDIVLQWMGGAIDGGNGFTLIGAWLFGPERMDKPDSKDCPVRKMSIWGASTLAMVEHDANELQPNILSIVAPPFGFGANHTATPCEQCRFLVLRVDSCHSTTAKRRLKGVAGAAVSTPSDDEPLSPLTPTSSPATIARIGFIVLLGYVGSMPLNTPHPPPPPPSALSVAGFPPPINPLLPGAEELRGPNHNMTLIDLLLVPGKEHLVTELASQGVSLSDGMKERLLPKLHEAARHHDAEQIALLCAIGVNFNAPMRGGMPPLFELCSSTPRFDLMNKMRRVGESRRRPSQADSVVALLRAGADPNLPDETGGGVLHRVLTAFNMDSISNDQGVQLFKLLIDYRADPRCVHPTTSDSVLMRVVKAGLSDLVEVVVNEAVTVEPEVLVASMKSFNSPILALLLNASLGRRAFKTQIEVGQALLEEACEHGTAGHVNVLIEAGATLPPVKEGTTCFHKAAERGYAGALSSLWRISDKARLNEYANALDEQGRSPLWLAMKASVASSATSFLTTLLSFGADVHFVYAGMTPLSWAAGRGLNECVSILLAAGANPNGHHSCPQSPLFLACHRGHSHVVSILLLSKASVSLISSDGDSALHVAAQGCYSSIVSLLIPHMNTALLNMTDSLGRTAMQRCLMQDEASKDECVSIVKALLKADASPLGTQPDPLHLATRHGMVDLAHTLLRIGIVSLRRDQRAVEEWLRMPHDGNCPNSPVGCTTLWHAIATTRQPMPADVSRRAFSTAAERAVTTSSRSGPPKHPNTIEMARLVRRLVMLGAPVDTPDRPLEAAVEFRKDSLGGLLASCGGRLSAAGVVRAVEHRMCVTLSVLAMNGRLLKPPTGSLRQAVLRNDLIGVKLLLLCGSEHEEALGTEPEPGIVSVLNDVAVVPPLMWLCVRTVVFNGIPYAYEVNLPSHIRTLIREVDWMDGRPWRWIDL